MITIDKVNNDPRVKTFAELPIGEMFMRTRDSNGTEVKVNATQARLKNWFGDVAYWIDPGSLVHPCAKERREHQRAKAGADLGAWR